MQGTVGSQSVNLTLNVNVSGGRSPGTPPRRADATDGTDGGKHGNNTNNAAPRRAPWTGLTLTVARYTLVLRCVRHITRFFPPKKVVNWTLENM